MACAVYVSAYLIVHNQSFLSHESVIKLTENHRLSYILNARISGKIGGRLSMRWFACIGFLATHQ